MSLESKMTNTEISTRDFAEEAKAAARERMVFLRFEEVRIKGILEGYSNVMAASADFLEQLMSREAVDTAHKSAVVEEETIRARRLQDLVAISKSNLDSVQADMKEISSWLGE